MASKPITNGHMNSASAEMERILRDVATHVGIIDWKMLARRLLVPECSIQNIDADCQKIEEKAFQALMKWFHMYGHSRATKEVLIEALREESNVIADEICKCHNIVKDPPQCTNSKPEQPNPQPAIKETYAVDDTLSKNTNSMLLLGKEHASMLKNSQINLATCDPATLAQRQKTLHHLHKMEIILFDMLKNCPLRSTTADLIENAKTDSYQRIEHTKQTMHLIQHLLEKITTGIKRSKSEVPKRTCSFADLRFDSKCRSYIKQGLCTSDISSPIFPRKNEELNNSAAIQVPSYRKKRLRLRIPKKRERKTIHTPYEEVSDGKIMTEEISKVNDVGGCIESPEESLRRPIEETNNDLQLEYLDMKMMQLRSHGEMGKHMSDVINILAASPEQYQLRIIQLILNMQKILKDMDTTWEAKSSVGNPTTDKLIEESKENHEKIETRTKTIKSEIRKRNAQSEIITGNNSEVTLPVRSATHPGDSSTQSVIEARISVLVSIAPTRTVEINSKNNDQTTKCDHCGVKKESVENEESDTKL